MNIQLGLGIIRGHIALGFRGKLKPNLMHEAGSVMLPLLLCKDVCVIN